MLFLFNLNKTKKKLYFFIKTLYLIALEAKQMRE